MGAVTRSLWSSAAVLKIRDGGGAYPQAPPFVILCLQCDDWGCVVGRNERICSIVSESDCLNFESVPLSICLAPSVPPIQHHFLQLSSLSSTPSHTRFLTTSLHTTFLMGGRAVNRQ